MEYILKRELEELLFDFEDERIHDVVKRRWKKDIKSFLFVSKSREYRGLYSLCKKRIFIKSVDANGYYMIN